MRIALAVAALGGLLLVEAWRGRREHQAALFVRLLADAGLSSESLARSMEQLAEVLGGLPDWFAWRLEAFAVAMADRDPRIVPWIVLRPGPWR